MGEVRGEGGGGGGGGRLCLLYTYLAIHDMQQLLQDHGNALVAEESGHDTVMDGADKALIEFDDAGVGVPQGL